MRTWISKRASTKLAQVVAMLAEAFEYAEDTASDRWDFAVPIEQLQECNINESDLRWLVKKGIVYHSREVTVEGKDGRQFKPTGDLTFCSRTCFVITDVGITKARELLDVKNVTGQSPSIDNSATRPFWFAENRELSIDGRIVKRFKWQAMNQETVLCAFEEEGWPLRIDDPLPPQSQNGSKRRLADTIRCLNGKQQNKLIHFRGDGTGEGVIWERYDENN